MAMNLVCAFAFLVYRPLTLSLLFISVATMDEINFWL